MEEKAVQISRSFETSRADRVSVHDRRERRFPRAVLRNVLVPATVIVGATWLLRAGRPVSQARQGGPAQSGPTARDRYAIEPSESRALYRVGDTLLRFNRPNALGVTRTIRGEILVDRKRLTNSRCQGATAAERVPGTCGWGGREGKRVARQKRS